MRGLSFEKMPNNGARVLWIGGSSALARTYFEEVHPARGVPTMIAAAPMPPSWQLPPDVKFVSLDLSSEDSVRTLFERLPHRVDSIIFGVRASLVYGTAEEHGQLTNNLGLLLRCAAAAGVTSMLHISSIAVADHVTTQHLVRESDPVPPIDEIPSPYDRFKLRSEQVVDEICGSEGSPFSVWTHLRISGIFSNDPQCIQCTAIRRQALASLATTACIDFNSSRNVGHAIALVLERQYASSHPEDVSHLCTETKYVGRQLYYYTRCTEGPTPYWRHVSDFRRANGYWFGLWFPGWLGDVVVPPMRALARTVGTEFAKSLDYLMAVASHEHSADNSAFRRTFPEIGGSEETIYECFLRLRYRHEEQRRMSGSLRAPYATSLLLLLVLCNCVLPTVLTAVWSSTAPLRSIFVPPPPPPLPWWQSMIDSVM